MDPESQELQLQRAGVPWENLFRDIGVSGSTGTQERRGWHRLDARLAGGDTLVVVAIDRIGRTWQDTIRSICSLRDRGVKIRSLAEAEAQWTRYLEADEGSPESFFGQVLVPCSRPGWRTRSWSPSSAGPGMGWSGPASRERPWGLPGRSAPGSWRRCGGCGKEEPASGGSPATSSARPAQCCGRCGGTGVG